MSKCGRRDGARLRFGMLSGTVQKEMCSVEDDMRQVYDYANARIANCPEEVRWVLGLFFELYGVIECEIHMQGACSDGPGPLKISTVWSRCILDEELEPLFVSKLTDGVYVVPIKNIPSS